MLKNMLKAVSRMISCVDDENVEGFKARVKCAKEIVDQLVEGLNSDISSKEATRIPSNVPDISSKEEEKYRVIIDDEGRLLSIENVLMDEVIELDGKRMKHSEAVGRKFKNVRVI